MKQVNEVLETSGGEMPDPNSVIHSESLGTMKSVFLVNAKGVAIKELIPEARGDLADQAQLDIDAEIEEKVSAIRLKNIL